MSQTTPRVSNGIKLKNLNVGDRVIYDQYSFSFMGESLYGHKGLLIGISSESPNTVLVLFDGDSDVTEVEFRALSQLTSGE